MAAANGKDAVRLCEHIVRQAFGPVVCRVASTLLNRGRLTAVVCARLAGISISRTQASLILLIQHDLVRSNGASFRNIDEDEAYEFDVKQCLYRLRRGRILAIVEHDFNEYALNVVKKLFLFGKLRFKDILEVCAAQNDGLATTSYQRAVVDLLRGRFLEPAHPEQHILVAEEMERKYLAKRRDRGTATASLLFSAKDLEDMRAKARDEVQEDLDRMRDPENVLTAVVINSKSKKSKGKERDRGSGKDADDSRNWTIDETKHLRVNYDKFDVLIRNELIIKATEDRWNRGAAAVMRAVLKASIAEQHSVAEERTAESVGPGTVMTFIQESAHKHLVSGLAGGQKLTLSELVKQYLAIMAGEDEVTSGGAFLMRGDSGSNPTYQVEFERICSKLKATVLQDIVKQRLGQRAARVLSVVIQVKNASETLVREWAMIPLREARVHLSELQKLSLIDIQEVPRHAATKGRQTFSGNDFHLWRIDTPKVFGTLLSGVYKTLANLIQRREVEAERRATALAKMERPDLQGMLEELSNKDQEDIAELENTLKMIALAEMRTEQVVMILRDLPGTGAPATQ